MNVFDEFTWEKVLSLYPKKEYKIEEYFKILSPEQPEFLQKYMNLGIFRRLKGIGLLCGTDWTNLYKNNFFYSRADHSLGVALIIWNFTKDKVQTLAGLFHDVATPVFSHVSDFRSGDALTQSSTEQNTAQILQSDFGLKELLKQDGIGMEEIIDYHKYPVADNEIPCLSADRLEYMFPSGMVLEGSWRMEEIKNVYNDISVLKNEFDIDELGFNTLEQAQLYCHRFCMTGHLLQLNENKVTLQMLAQIMTESVRQGILQEKDFMECSEKEIICKLDDVLGQGDVRLETLQKMYRTFRNMGKVKHTEKPLKNHFCVSLKVKQRYINPLVKTPCGTKRIYDVSPKAKKIIDDFKLYEDTPFGCVEYL